MKSRRELDLMRLLHGELPEEQARELRRRMESDPGLAEEFQRLRRGWEGLSLPPASPAPPGFARRVADQARSGLSRELAWGLAPGWVRAAAAAALVAGAALGVGIGRSLPLSTQTETPVAVQADSGEETLSTDDSLAESYWSALDDLADEP